MRTTTDTASGDSPPSHPQKLRCGAFPAGDFVGGEAVVGAEAELIDLGPACWGAFGRGEVAQGEGEGLWSVGAGDLALADEGAARAAVAAPFVLVEDDAEAIGLRELECDSELGALGAVPEGIGDFAA